jgi:hypothetical protein
MIIPFTRDPAPLTTATSPVRSNARGKDTCDMMCVLIKDMIVLQANETRF